MSAHSVPPERQTDESWGIHLGDNLRDDLGPVFIAALEDPATTDLRITGGGHVVCTRQGVPKVIGTIRKDAVDLAIRRIATHVHAPIGTRAALYGGDFPLNGCRMQIIMPPVSRGPMIVLRKPATRIYSFVELVQQGEITSTQARYLTDIIASGEHTIAVTGGAGAGKTTFCNAILKEVAKYPRLMVLLEDARELQPSSPPEYIESLCTRLGFGVYDDAPMTELVATALRMYPRSISMGELRQAPAAVALIEAFNSGHPGGFVTYHANNALDALYRIQWLLEEGGMTPLPARIAKAINVVVHLRQVAPGARRVEELVRVLGHDGREYQLEHIA